MILHTYWLDFFHESLNGKLSTSSELFDWLLGIRIRIRVSIETKFQNVPLVLICLDSKSVVFCVITGLISSVRSQFEAFNIW